MERITRKGIAFEPGQLREFDMLMKKKGYKNRSEAIRDLIRSALIEQKEMILDATMMGSLTMVYNHNEHDVQHELTHIEHHAGELIRSSLHVHMDEDSCMEVLILEGKVRSIKSLADSIIATKGVKHGKLVLTG